MLVVDFLFVICKVVFLELLDFLKQIAILEPIRRHLVRLLLSAIPCCLGGCKGIALWTLAHCRLIRERGRGGSLLGYQLKASEVAPTSPPLRINNILFLVRHSVVGLVNIHLNVLAIVSFHYFPDDFLLSLRRTVLAGVPTRHV